jgi:hypothetical protein
MRILILKIISKNVFVAISLLMATSISYANIYCDMASCASPVKVDSGSAVICNRTSSDCDCQTLPSDCYAARRVNHSCTGKDGWVQNNGKMIGNHDGSICCGFKLAPGAKCPDVPKDDQPVVSEIDYTKGFFHNDFFGWKDFDLISGRGPRAEFEKAYLDICIGAHHTDEFTIGTDADKWDSCYHACKNPKLNQVCKSKMKNSNFSICANNCNCIYHNNECLRN